MKIFLFFSVFSSFFIGKSTFFHLQGPKNIRSIKKLSNQDSLREKVIKKQFSYTNSLQIGSQNQQFSLSIAILHPTI
jgi:hypothetical protein